MFVTSIHFYVCIDFYINIYILLFMQHILFLWLFYYFFVKFIIRMCVISHKDNYNLISTDLSPLEIRVLNLWQTVWSDFASVFRYKMVVSLNIFFLFVLQVFVPVLCFSHLKKLKRKRMNISQIADYPIRSNYSPFPNILRCFI